MIQTYRCELSNVVMTLSILDLFRFVINDGLQFDDCALITQTKGFGDAVIVPATAPQLTSLVT
jgi:hypothetical protein